MRVLLFTIAFFYAQYAYTSDNEVNIFFIGNSLTYANNLPGMIVDIARSMGDKLYFEAIAPGGANLQNHAANPKVLTTIQGKSWDFVVLQEQSQRPAFSKRQVARDVYPYAEKLSDAVRKSNKETKIVFFMTMARRNGDPGNRNVSADLVTYEGMQKRVNSSYIKMAKSNSARVAPVGEVWAAVRKERPSLNLYSDEIHPNLTGSYLAACVLYVAIFKKTSVGAPIPTGVDKKDGVYMQKLVDRIVLHSGNQWSYDN